MKKLTFSANWDVMFDYRGITKLPSGTAPHYPGQARIVVNTVEATHYTMVENDTCAAAADAGQKALELWVRKTYVGADERAERALAIALQEKDW